MPSLPRIVIVTPALAKANNGNWQTARRWHSFLAPIARVALAREWTGQPADALIALHARRSAGSIERFHARHPARGLALVLTGTDLYRDIATDPTAAQSLARAHIIVGLQSEAPRELPLGLRGRARVIVQSSPARQRIESARFTLVAVGHLREEKDPRTWWRAIGRLSAGHGMQFVQLGGPLDPALGAAARALAASTPAFRWLGAVAHERARRWIARARALVITSRMEGGANVVIEAIVSGVPVLASRIPGNIGLLGRDYRGFFPPGDDRALAALMMRMRKDAAFRRGLERQCAARAPLFAPALERAAVRRLARDLLAVPEIPLA